MRSLFKSEKQKAIEYIKSHPDEYFTSTEWPELSNLPEPEEALYYKTFLTADNQLIAIVSILKPYVTYYQVHGLKVWELDRVPLDRKTFEPEQKEEAQKWLDNWCENAQIHQLWKDSFRSQGKLNCSCD